MCQGRVKCQSSPSTHYKCFVKIQVFFFSSVQLIIYNQYFDDYKILYNLKFEDVAVLFHFTILAVYLHYL